jgi:hypothetical protein
MNETEGKKTTIRRYLPCSIPKRPYLELKKPRYP